MYVQAIMEDIGLFVFAAAPYTVSRQEQGKLNAARGKVPNGVFT
jgi:hypothetical protein